MARRDPELPDGWIRTPLPPRRVEETPEASWFARTGEPAPPRRPPPSAPEAMPAQRVAVALAVLAALFAAVTVGGILLLGG